MPQLNVDHFPAQVFWLFLFFAILFFVLSRFLLPAVDRIFESRQRRISLDIDQTDDIKKQAQEIIENCDLKLRNAHEEAAEIINQTKKDIAARRADFALKVQKLRDDFLATEQQVISLRDKLLADLDKQAVVDDLSKDLLSALRKDS